MFVFHAARPGLPGGFIGVDVFFVLSGYLITRILINEHEANGHVRIARFYSRRVRRLMPAVVVLVAVVATREALYGEVLVLGARLRDSIATLFYFMNWNLIWQADQYFLEATSASPLRHAWSLSIEEQFYLIWPVALIGILALVRRNPKRAIIVVAALAAISALLMAVLYEPTVVDRAYYGTDTRVHQPLIGAALALAIARRSESDRIGRFATGMWAAVAMGGTALIIVGARVLSGSSPAYYLGGSLAVAVATAVVILGLERAPESLVAKVFSWNPLKQLGRISYGVYLWHWPVILWLAVPEGFGFLERRVMNLAQFGLTVTIATASY